MHVSFQNIGELYATFHCDEAIPNGTPVSMIGSETVAPCLNNDIPCGVAGTGRNGACRVQVAGFVTLPYSGPAPDVGFTGLVGNGSGGLMASETGRKLLVAAVDRASKTVTVLL